jgi:hypothetical protein
MPPQVAPEASRELLDKRIARFDPLAPDFISYCMLMLVVFTDNVGMNFSAPIGVPYVQELGGTVSDAGTVMTANAAAKILGGLLVPILADNWSSKKTIFLSMIGSVIAYTLAGTANFVGGFTLYIVARCVGGLFGGSMSLCSAMLIKLSGDNLTLLKTRQTYLRACVLALSNQRRPAETRTHRPVPCWQADQGRWARARAHRRDHRHVWAPLALLHCGGHCVHRPRSRCALPQGCR